ncbi:MAG: tRNA (adenosine(37)-N6)-threonylcarbamoyltransferase complex ATPase subunit type 1 TsaE [Chitinophagales bacterium]|nr:tRNA (adenosine(37)-N6)-threonylcarbamoyltransferase complex ATPase subunit type 1 TsaE [Chitinophagales bacterium]
MEEIQINDLNELPSVAKAIIHKMTESKLVAFSGDLGSGKTTLIGEICRQLGVEDSCSSPTFSIVNEYLIAKANRTVFHIDLYRLKDREEIWNTGIGEYISGKDYCFIEWPEKIKDDLPSGSLYTEIAAEEESEKRKLTIFKL